MCIRDRLYTSETHHHTYEVALTAMQWIGADRPWTVLKKKKKKKKKIWKSSRVRAYSFRNCTFIITSLWGSARWWASNASSNADPLRVYAPLGAGGQIRSLLGVHFTLYSFSNISGVNFYCYYTAVSSLGRKYRSVSVKLEREKKKNIMYIISKKKEDTIWDWKGHRGNKKKEKKNRMTP